MPWLRFAISDEPTFDVLLIFCLFAARCRAFARYVVFNSSDKDFTDAAQGEHQHGAGRREPGIGAERTQDGAGERAGCIRDTDEINACEIGVRALAAHPQKSSKKGAGERNVRVWICGVAVNPGDWIYADADGVLVAQQKLS